MSPGSRPIGSAEHHQQPDAGDEQADDDEQLAHSGPTGQLQIPGKK